MEQFVLSDEEMLYLGYLTESQGRYRAQTSAQRTTVWFLDCEMVETTLGTEVAVIGFGKQDDDGRWCNHIVKTKPKGEVVDYITPITGLDSNTVFDMSLEQGIDFLLKCLNKDDIIIGHHLYIDLKALNLYHGRVIDCCMIFHHPDGPPYYYSLKELASVHLKRQIQTGAHDPTEDGIAGYDLIRWCVDQGYVKTVWQNIGQKFIPSIEDVVKALRISRESIQCLFTRGSRAIGTNKPDSDYDLVAVCDVKNIINGTLTRYGNIDICCYDTEYFVKMLKDQIIWAIECIYCPSELIYVEKTNYRPFYEKYRSDNPVRSNEMLKRSVGFESSRKMASAKKHFHHGDTYHAKKHVFIGIRFVEYARQIVNTNKIQNIKCANYIWDMLKNAPECHHYNEFKALWQELYIKLYRDFSSFAPKKQNQKKGSWGSGTEIDSLSRYDQITDLLGPDNINALKTICELTTKLDALDKLKSEHMINVYPSKKYPDLVLLRYTNKTPDHMIKYVSRGLILDKKTKSIVSYPFNNFVDAPEIPRDQDILHIFEKIDGSFVSLYHYDGSWHVSTSRNPDGDSVIGIRKNSDIVFDQLFWQTFKSKGYDTSMLNPRYNYMFELVSKDHVIIIQYEADDLFLIGVRDISSPLYNELDIMGSEFDLWNRPKVYHDLKSVDQMDPETHEGCVVVTKRFDRFKIKKPEYVKKAFMFPLCTRNKNINMDIHVLKVIQESEEKEFCKYCPEYQSSIHSLKTVYDEFINKVKKMYSDILPQCRSRKDYATFIQGYDRIYHKYLFALYDKQDIYTFMANQKTKRLYGDLFVKKAIKRTINDYGYTPENKYGKYAQDVLVWEKEQIEKAKLVVTEDLLDINKIRYCGGLDISFDPQDDTVGVSYITIYDLLDKRIVHEDHQKVTLNIPYISGFLGFREVGVYMDLLKRVKDNKPEFYPDVLMIDGFGILHHRGFGSASHIGYCTQIPTIGVGKTLLYVDGMDEHKVKDKFRQECKRSGDYIDLIGDSGKVYGVAYKSTDDSMNPIYISVGHNISLESCIKIVKMCTRYRVPEPIRNSDIKSKLFMK